MLAGSLLARQENKITGREATKELRLGWRASTAHLNVAGSDVAVSRRISDQWLTPTARWLRAIGRLLESNPKEELPTP